MRWNINKKKYKMRESRMREGFLFLPGTLNGERRWLEHAKWEEEVCSIGTTGYSEKIIYGWTPIRWVD